MQNSLENIVFIINFIITDFLGNRKIYLTWKLFKSFIPWRQLTMFKKVPIQHYFFLYQNFRFCTIEKILSIKVLPFIRIRRVSFVPLYRLPIFPNFSLLHINRGVPLHFPTQHPPPIWWSSQLKHPSQTEGISLSQTSSLYLDISTSPRS